MKITPRDVLENYEHSGGLEEDYKNILLVEAKPVWLDSFYALLDINNFYIIKNNANRKGK